jgi:hypothetical protein
MLLQEWGSIFYGRGQRAEGKELRAKSKEQKIPNNFTSALRSKL